MTDRIRLLVVDDHPVFRRGLLAVLSDAEDIDVVGAVGTGTEAIESAAGLAPDVILLDLNLPDTNGSDLTKELVGAGSPTAGTPSRWRVKRASECKVARFPGVEPGGFDTLIRAWEHTTT